MNKIRNNKSAFTLVELSVVLVLIGIIAGMVVASTSIIDSANLRSAITEMAEHSIALKRFQEKFKYLPGDFASATKYWSGTSDGDKNWAVDNSIGAGDSEDVRAWQHMELAGIINGSYTGAYESGKLNIGINLPRSSIKNGGYWFVTGGSVYGRTENILRLAAPYTPTGYSPICGGLLNPKDARQMDEKIDDGIPDEGIIFALNACGFTKASSNACVDGDPTDASASYNLSNQDKTCMLNYYIYH